MDAPGAEWLGRVRVVLVRARNPGNIGAVARAMYDFGFSDLRSVSDFGIPLEAAQAAVDASAVLAGARACGGVAEAVAGCTLAVGTTAVGARDVQHPLLGLVEAAARMRSEVGREDGLGRVALLFGSEKTGLSNDEMSFCDVLLTIPMAEYAGVRHPSMNLAQAVAVCLWELVRGGSVRMAAAAELAPADEVERVHGVLMEVLAATEYTRRHAATAGAGQIRRLVHRMGMGEAEVAAWMGILRQVLWKLGRGVE